MKFNSYIWSLFKKSKEGQEAISFFKKLPTLLLNDPHKKLYNFYCQHVYVKADIEFFYVDMAAAHNIFYEEIKCLPKVYNIKEAEELYRSLFTNGILVDYGDGKEDIILKEHNCQDTYELLHPLSYGLYKAYPHYFFPYLFIRYFFKLSQIFNIFNIPLPKIPKRYDHLNRLHYYFELCKTLYEFRTEHKMTPEELCAFIYCFAPNFITEYRKTELPEPSKSYLTGADGRFDAEFLENSDFHSISNWMCNLETLPGDIIVIYTLAPRSCIQTIGRALTEGFIDPFFYYYQTIWVGRFIKINPIHLSELKTDKILSRCGVVRRNMQGVNGYPINKTEYERILEIEKNKNFDITKLPKIKDVGLPDSIKINNEKDVEVKLLEPLLERLGYKKQEWIRQMPLRMGRGEKFYPDYVVLPKLKRGEESGFFIWEAKCRINNKSQLKQDFYQAKSYALRLNSYGLGLVSYEGIWLSYEEDNLSFEKLHYYNWSDLNDTDIFHMIYKKIGKPKQSEGVTH